MRLAIQKANELNVPLIVAGDLHDTKANLRGECVNAMLLTFKECKILPYVLVGNHDRINERAEAHSLNFLSEYSTIVDTPTFVEEIDMLIPYYHDPAQLIAYLTDLSSGSRIIMHQGCHGSKSGDYIQDKSALPAEVFKDFRVISGHYHTRQDIKCGRPKQGAVGLFSYIGNPYTLNFAEAKDPEKGFQVLMNDGTLEFVPTNLRKHVVLEGEFSDDNELRLPDSSHCNPEDIVLIRILGTKTQLSSRLIEKSSLKHLLALQSDFRLDLIPTETISHVAGISSPSQEDLLDFVIDSLSNTRDEQKARLKDLWRSM